MIAWPAANLLLGVVLGAGPPHPPPTTQPTAEVMVRDAGGRGVVRASFDPCGIRGLPLAAEP